MATALLLMFVLSAPGQVAEQQGVTGIFLTIDCRRNIPKHQEMLTSKSICLTQSPIIYPKDFEAIGIIKDIGSKIYFDLKFTPRGYETLLKLTENLADAKLALVVEDQVFFVFKSAELKLAPTFRFQTVSKFRNQMEEVHRQLGSAMEASAGKNPQ